MIRTELTPDELKEDEAGSGLFAEFSGRLFDGSNLKLNCWQMITWAR